MRTLFQLTVFFVFMVNKVASAENEIDCGDTMFTSSSGFIRLPSNPNEYSAKVDCNYTISTNNASTFSIGILSLHLPQLLDSSADCDRDYVMIGCVSDGETELNPNTSKTYCRRSFDNIPVQPSRIIVFSNCSMVKISIRSSDYNYQGDSSIPFTVSSYDEDCGSTVFSGSTGIINSPRFPLSYPHRLDCVYSIDVDRTVTVTLESLSFNLEGVWKYSWDGDYHCNHTWLMVNCILENGSTSANPNQNKKFCGDRRIPLLLKYSNCDFLTINFVTNTSVSTHGFQFRYEVISTDSAVIGNTTPPTPDKHRVNTSVTGRSGFITSPHYPLSYPHNIDYTYTFYVNQTNTVELQFYSFNVEGKTISYYLDTCHYDWLTITCLPQNNDYPTRKYCGEKATRLIKGYSKCASLTLNFVSDSSITRGGFKIGYRIMSPGQPPGCGDILFSGPSGIIVTPNFPDKYPHNVNCKYSIDVGRNNSVQLRLKHFELKAPGYTGYCTKDWLMVTCKETTIANPNYGKKYCGVIHWTSSLRFVDCPTLELEFVSGSYKYGDWGSRGFVIEYNVTENANTTDDNSELDCGNTLFAESSGNVSFPITGYLATVNCTYTISTNRTDVIWLNYTYATMWRFLQSFHCHDAESLMIGCVSNEETALIDPSTKTLLCRHGHLANPQQIQLLYPACRTLKLSIRSTTYAFQETFRISFSVIGSNEICGNTSLSSPTGVISTLRLPFRYPKFVNCLYTVDCGNSAAVSVDHIYGYINAGKYYGDSLTITCLVNGTSVAVREVSPTTRYNSRTAGFPACQSLVLNFTSESISEERGLTVRYRMEDYEIDCGTTLFTNTSGNISFPRNPTGYPATANCTYTISAKDLTHIWINAYVTDWTRLLNSFQDCSREWLMIGCESEESSELNPKTKKVYCQKDISSQISRPNEFLFDDCRMLKLSIRSRTYDLREPFLIGYVAVVPDEICGKTSFSDITGTVFTPVSKFWYQKHVNCLYTIDSVQVDTYVLNIAVTSLGSCDARWLTITCLINGTVVAHPLAGRKLCTYRDYGITGRLPACDRVMLNFTSSYVTTYSFFSVRYRIGDYELGCGASMFSKSSGVIVLPAASTDHPAAVNCTYTISTNRTRDIWLDFGQGVLKYISDVFQDCSRENLTIGCLSVGATELNPNTSRVFCGSRIATVSHSEYVSSNTKRLVFIDCPTLKVSIRSTTYDLRIGIRINFTVHGRNEICGNTSLSAQYGIISPPSLPSRYPTRINCVYAIESEHVNSVVLRVDRLHIGSFSTTYYGPCYSGDWLTITCLVNGTPMDHPLADKKLCGNYHDPFFARFPACRSVLFNFSSDYATENTGFIIRYSIGDYDPECGKTTFGDSNGVITSPEFPLSHPHTLNCLYSITSFQRNAISLSFLSFRLDGYSNSNPMDEDHCWSGGDSLTVSCLSDEAAVMNYTSSIRKFCGAKTTPLTFAFPSCAVVMLHFRSKPNENARQEGFKVSYTVREADQICGTPIYGRPSGVINVPWNYADYNGALNCSYVINAMEPSSISLTISSISIQGLAGGNCQRDWLLIKCIEGPLSMNLSLTHITCNYLNTSTQITFPDCTATSIKSHRNAQTTGRKFRIDYTITRYGDNIPTTELPTTSVSVHEPVSITEAIGTTKSCEAGCALNSDSTKCDCLPGTSQTAAVSISQEIPVTRTADCKICCKLSCGCSTTLADMSQTSAIPVSTEIPVTRSAKCELGCKLSEDGTTCDCSTMHSDTNQSAAISVSMENPAMQIAECDVGCELSADGTTCDCSTSHADDLVVNIQMSVSDERGHPIGISMAVILAVTGAICLSAFLLFRRAKTRSEVRTQENKEERTPMELKTYYTEAAHRSQDQDISL